MDILCITYRSLEKKELINFLRGDKEYMVELSQYAPVAELPDTGKILSKGIYRVYKEDKHIKIEYEQALLSMLEMSDYDVYIVCIYLTSQLFKEKNALSPFVIEKQKILVKLKEEIEKRKTLIQNGIDYPNGYQNKKAWQELERFNNVCKEEYNLTLF